MLRCPNRKPLSLSFVNQSSQGFPALKQNVLNFNSTVSFGGHQPITIQVDRWKEVGSRCRIWLLFWETKLGRADRMIGGCRRGFISAKYQNCLPHVEAITIISPAPCLAFFRTLSIMGLTRKAQISYRVQRMRKASIREPGLEQAFDTLYSDLWQTGLFLGKPIYKRYSVWASLW